jgi:hypothetical protein
MTRGMRWLFLWVVVGGSAVTIAADAQATAGSASPAKDRPDLVAIYFPGYHQDDHYDAWFGEGWNEWQLLAQAPTRFPGHRLFRPAWGSFDEADPNWMARQVALAADHGLDVFLFDWYWYSGVQFLQRPLEQGFLRSTNQSRLKFALMWANHDWCNYFPAPKDSDPTLWLPSRATPKDFARLVDCCNQHYFCRTNYWRPQGGLYFGIFDTESFVGQLGGPTKTKAVLDNARQRVRRAGLGEVHFGAFHGSAESVARVKDAGFDSVTVYNLSASGKASLPARPLDDYTDLVDNHSSFWRAMDTGLLPFLPVLTVGWDCTPRWTKDAEFPPK